MAKITARKIVLIGAMGSGKSTLGIAYAARHDKTVYDTDAEFTRRYGDISAYFESNGEQAFRKIESELLIDAANSTCDIIACGGGAVLDKKGMNALRRVGDIVYLTAPIEVLKSRVSKSDRPLKNDIDTVFDRREKLYIRYADYTVNTDRADAVQALERALTVPRKNRYDVLLCDSDDTLLDFKTAMRRSVINAARAVGITKPDDKIVFEYAAIIKEIWERLERGEITRAQLDIQRFEILRDRLNERFDPQEMNDIYINEMRATRFVIDGAVEFLNAVRARGIKVYIITNSFTRIAKERLKALDMAIDGAFISEEIGHDKPDVRFFEKVYKKIGMPDKSRTLVFGDSVTSDIAGGMAFGVDTCLFDVSGNKPNVADYTVGSYAELMNII